MRERKQWLGQTDGVFGVIAPRLRRGIGEGAGASSRGLRALIVGFVGVSKCSAVGEPMPQCSEYESTAVQRAEALNFIAARQIRTAAHRVFGMSSDAA